MIIFAEKRTESKTKGMKYEDFRKARKIGKDEANATLLGKLYMCEEMLEALDKIKNAGNKNEEGKPRYAASITLNIHGGGEDDANEKDLRSLSYDTNFDYVEKKVRENYDRFIKDFEERTQD